MQEYKNIWIQEYRNIRIYKYDVVLVQYHPISVQLPPEPVFTYFARAMSPVAKRPPESWGIGQTANLLNNMMWPRPANSELPHIYCWGNGHRRANFRESIGLQFPGEHNEVELPTCPEDYSRKGDHSKTTLSPPPLPPSSVTMTTLWLQEKRS